MTKFYVKKLSIFLLVVICFAVTTCAVRVFANDVKAEYKFYQLSIDRAAHLEEMNNFLKTNGGSGSIDMADGKVSVNYSDAKGNANNALITWTKLPKKLVGGEHLTFTASAVGAHAITHFYLYAGDNVDKLKKVDGKIYGTKAGTFEVDFDIPSNKKYVGIMVYGSNSNFGMGGTYIFSTSIGHTLTLERGSASIIKTGDNSTVQLEVGKPVGIATNDIIKTGANTRTVINFPDGSVFKLKSDTVASLLKDGIQLQAGEMWFDLQKQSSTFQVVTPTTVCGVLGATFSVEVAKDGKTNVLLYKGKLDVSDKNNNKTSLNAGQKIVADSAGISAPQNLEANETTEEWDSNAPSKQQISQVYVYVALAVVVFAVVILLLIISKIRAKKQTKFVIDENDKQV